MAVLQHLLQLYIAINICIYINCPFAKMNFILAGVQVYKIMYKLGSGYTWPNVVFNPNGLILEDLRTKFYPSKLCQIFLCGSFLTIYTGI